MPLTGRWEDFGNGSLQYIVDGYLGLLTNATNTLNWEWNLIDLAGRNHNMPRGKETNKSLADMKNLMEDALNQIVDRGSYTPRPETVITAVNMEDENVAKKSKSKSKKSEVNVILEDLSLAELAKDNQDIATRLEVQFKGMPEDMKALCLGYVANKDNGHEEIFHMIFREAKKIHKNILMAGETKTDSSINLDLFRSHKDSRIKWRTKEEVKGDQKADIAKHINITTGDANKIGSFGVNYLGEEAYSDAANKNYLAVMVSEPVKEQLISANIQDAIKMSRGNIAVGIDLPLSIIAGRLSYEYMMKIIKFAVDKHDVTYDFKAALNKYIDVNRKKQAKVYEDEMQQASNEIVDYQTHLADSIGKYSHAKTKHEIAMKSCFSDIDTIMKDIDKVRNAGYCSDIYYEKEQIVAVLPDIRVQFKDKEYKFGDFIVRINIANGVTTAFGDGKHTSDNHFHPHVKVSGTCCLGNYQKLISEFVLNGEFGMAISHMLEFLVNYNEANPFIRINAWDKYSEKKSVAKDTLVTATAAQ